MVRWYKYEHIQLHNGPGLRADLLCDLQAMDAKYDVPWGAKASWIFFHCSTGWRGNFCGPLIHRKYRCGLKVLRLFKMSTKRTMYLESWMFKSIQKFVFLHVLISLHSIHCIIAQMCIHSIRTYYMYERLDFFAMFSWANFCQRSAGTPGFSSSGPTSAGSWGIEIACSSLPVLDANMTYRYLSPIEFILFSP